MSTTTDRILAQMNANSEAWHTADENTRRRLEAENKTLGAQVGAVKDESTGKWTSTSGTNLLNYDSDSYQAAVAAGKNIDKSTNGTATSYTAPSVSRVTALETGTPEALTDKKGNPIGNSMIYTKSDGYAASDGKTYTRPYTNYAAGEDSMADYSNLNLSDSQWEQVLGYKNAYTTAEVAYNRALLAGDSAAATAALAAMEEALAGAESVRAGSGYSAGSGGYGYNIIESSGSGSTGSTPTGMSIGASTGGTVSSSGLGSYGGTNTGTDVTDFSGYLQELYDARIAANLAALESAYKQNVNTLDSAASRIPEEYEAAKNQAAASAAQSQRNFNQYASVRGLNSGTSAQATLANNVALQNSLATVNSAEASALADLELQRTQLATEYENAIVQAKANGDYQLAEALYAESVRVAEALQAQQNYLAQLELEQQRYEDSLALQKEQLAQSQANSNYSKGLELAQYLYKATGDASLLADYGYTDDQIAALRYQWELANTAPTTSGDTGSSGTYKPTLTAAQTLAALQNGVVNDSTLAAYEYYYGQPWTANDTVEVPGLDEAVSVLAQMVNNGDVSQKVAEEVVTELEKSGNAANGALISSLGNKSFYDRVRAGMAASPF